MIGELKPGWRPEWVEWAREATEEFPEAATRLMPFLHRVQAAEGWLRPEALEAAATLLGLPLTYVESVVSFYHLFRTEPTGRRVIHVCRSLSASRLARRRPTAPTRCWKLRASPRATWLRPCRSTCGLSARYGRGKRADCWRRRCRCVKTLDRHYLLRHRDVPGIRALDVYEAHDGYQALRRALREFQPEALVDLCKASGLRGRGGAGFPTGVKWGFLPKDGRPRMLVVNADEGEPGTFKDRELMEHNPHQLIEGMLITAYAIQAPASYIYIRGEFLHAYEVVTRAIAEAAARGYLGDNILDSGFSHRMYVYRGAGAYICGEETALLESLEGKRGNPRLKPPFPAVSGLYGLPTVVNNVETLMNLPPITLYGAEWYRQWGTEKSPGIKVMSVSGHVERPGNYEVPLDATLNEVIALAGGVRRGHRVKAVIPGGSSMPLLPADKLDTPIDYESLVKAGSMLGSGGLMVMDETTCMVAAAERVVRFYRDESCGKCTPCREGTYWLTDVLERLEQGIGDPTDIDLLVDVSDNINGKAFCPLGDAAVGFLVSAVKYFRDEFLEHITGRTCPLGATHYDPVNY
jgi:NADH-quinone oxidoreductase subunit F